MLSRRGKSLAGERRIREFAETCCTACLE